MKMRLFLILTLLFTLTAWTETIASDWGYEEQAVKMILPTTLNLHGEYLVNDVVIGHTIILTKTDTSFITQIEGGGSDTTEVWLRGTASITKPGLNQVIFDWEQGISYYVSARKEPIIESDTLVVNGEVLVTGYNKSVFTFEYEGISYTHIDSYFNMDDSFRLLESKIDAISFKLYMSIFR